jgi:hypothetical protein
MAKERIRAILIFEVLGRPKEYIEEVMKKFLETMSERKEVELISKQILEPKKVENAKDVYTIVAETEFYFKDIETLLGFMLDTMPASIEIIEPTQLTFDLPRINAFMNDYLTKLHQYDDVYKKLKLEREILIRKLIELENLLKKAKGEEKGQKEGGEKGQKSEEEKGSEEKKKD